MSPASGAQGRDVLIVGGGIGGVANALALGRGGANVKLVERAAEFKEVGAGLQMAPNATRILKSWGLLDEILEVGVRPKEMVFRDAISGEELTRQELGGAFEERYGAPYIVLHRTDLHSVLVRAARESGAELVNDVTIDHVETLDGRGHARDTAGREYEADVILGADGLTSTLRKHLVDDAVVPSGYVAYRGAIPMVEATNVEDVDNVVVYLGPRCHLVQYPLRSGTMFNTVAVFRSESFVRGDEEFGGQDELAAAYSECIPQVQAALANLWQTVRWPMYDREPIPDWVDGRLVLTGDAAHPMLQYLAQGACQALEDAAVFGRLSSALLSGSGAPSASAWDAVLRDFNDLRAPRTARVQSTARVWGESWHVDTPIPHLLRNLLFKARRDTDVHYTDWLYGDVPGLQPVL